MRIALLLPRLMPKMSLLLVVGTTNIALAIFFKQQ
jgi:hypothetical protein